MENNSYKFFKGLIDDVTYDYRINQNKNYDIEKTIDNLYNDDDLWQALMDAIWDNLVEREEE